VVTNVAASNAVARGVVLLSAAYTDIPNFRPLVDAPSTEVRSVRPAFGSSVFTPAQIANLAEFQGQFLVERPFQFRSSVDSLGNTTTTGTGRQYGNLSTRVYYSNRADASALGGPPIIYSTSLTNPAPNVVSVDVAVGGLDAEGIEDVFATFTSEPTDARNSLYGKWTSVPLRLSSSVTNGIGLINHYTASIDTSGTGANPQSVRLFVQAVSGTGLVSLATNNGAYYQFVPETATLGNPKAATSLTLQPPATPYVATYRSHLTVSSHRQPERDVHTRACLSARAD
jgi:hypothetical protein